ncbi:MAG: glycosyltransferase [Burkholderiales bacterium]|nr:glycosyltransferase [Burkholderiales bacterium]
MKYIIVNTVAFTHGGSFIILEDFLKNITYRSNIRYIIFCSVSKFDFDLAKNITIVNPNSKSWLRRLYWDFYGLKKWVMKNKIKSSLLFSLQSCGSNFFSDIPQIIYYHQPMPIYEHKWNLFKPNERTLWLKKNILKFIIKLFIFKNSKFIVQLESIKSRIAKSFSVGLDHIKVFYPSIPNDVDQFKIVSKSKIDLFNVLYPASAMPYKNHIEIVNAINYMRSSGFDISRIKIYFTSITPDHVPELYELIQKNKLSNNFIFTGQMSRIDLLEMYLIADVLLFPSYIETFGLPLVEAASFGLPIAVADEDYAHEVLKNYDGVEYLPINNPKVWSDYLLKMKDRPRKYKPMNANVFSPSWKELINYIESEAIDQL